MTDPALTVIICTHNPRPGPFGQCLTALCGQTLGQESWELVVVDNKSDPGLSGLDLSWHRAGRLVREETLGLTPARLRGIREAVGALLVFVDDDNVLDEDYLEVALEVARNRPHLGAWSGQCRPGFDEPPPEWTRRYWGNLVIREFERDVWSNLPRLAETMPCGAGLCVRKVVAGHYLHLHESGARRMQLDRSGDSLLSGGDNDLAGGACTLGLGVGLIAAQRLTHIISGDRLTEDYLERLAEGIQFSSTILDYEFGIRPSERSAIGHIADFLRALRMKPPHRKIYQAALRGRRRAVRWLRTAKPMETTANVRA